MRKRTMNIIFSIGDYVTNFSIAGVDTLESRLRTTDKTLFHGAASSPMSGRAYLLPDKCDSSTVNKLRHSKTFHLLTAKTERFKNSFIPLSYPLSIIRCVLLC